MSYSSFKYITGRELGQKNGIGWKDNLYSSLYSSVSPYKTTESTPSDGLNWGAVFGFGFSSDGSLLAAACENKCMLLYDPHNAQLIGRRFKTHTDCVNCIRFLDNRTFATCSDDNTVRLWDARYLAQEIRILKGHTSWVKNIEYSSSEGKLITSGFDGNIFAWDINNYSENEKAEPLFFINGIMRTKLTPDEKTMIVSTLGGYFLLIHELDLDYLKDDLQGFKPHLYRLMQLMNTPFNHALQYNHMFTRKRNRVEFICDFPDADKAESISTMQVHPQGWCIASRNTTLDEESEWTCVHDIQDVHGNSDVEYESDASTVSSSERLDDNDINFRLERQLRRNPPQALARNSLAYPLLSGDLTRPNLFGPVWSRLYNGSNDDSSDEDPNSNELNDYDEEPLSTGSPTLSPYHRLSSSSSDTSSSSDDLSNSSISHEIELPETLNSDNISNIDPPNGHMSNNESIGTRSDRVFPASPYENNELRDLRSGSESPTNIDTINDRLPRDFVFYEMTISQRGRTRRRMALRHLNQSPRSLLSPRFSCMGIRNVKPRLLFYSEEPNVGRGFIKEQSFSPDGRVLASPFANCVRLLAFNESCSELCDSVPSSPRPLCQIAMTLAQKSSILASTFSPVHCMFVAGARDGSISFCSPKL
ncbi:unnamed protein product [Lymnaea stagnalis]|uniref:Uncharacterized protein n=1 Tax=Lymnaea stagnalis TaxID=6523 RepID=A0AAV2HMM0_LYMST